MPCIARRSDDTIRAVVLTGAGNEAFCAGADLGADAFVFDYATPTNAYADLLRTARTLTVPLVARVNGACMAGGMGLLAMCDLAIAAPHAIFGLPEAKVGVFPMQVLAVLQAQVPQRCLAQLCLTGDPIDAARAREIGLVNEVADDLDGALERLLSRLQSQLAHRAAARPVRDEGDALDVVRGGDRVRRRADRPAGDDAGRARGHRRIQGKEETAMDRQVKPQASGKEKKMHKNEVALITGANKGLGFEIARQLGQQGVTVVLGARDDAKAKAAADKLEAEGVDAHAVKLDVTNESDVEALAAFFESKFGRLDILVNNAGVRARSRWRYARDIPPDIRDERHCALLHHAGAAAAVEGQPGRAHCESVQHHGIDDRDERSEQLFAGNGPAGLLLVESGAEHADRHNGANT